MIGITTVRRAFVNQLVKTSFNRKYAHRAAASASNSNPKLTLLKTFWRKHKLDMGLSVYDTAVVGRLKGSDGNSKYPQLVKKLNDMTTDQGLVGPRTDSAQHNIISSLSTANTFLQSNPARFAYQIQNLMTAVVENSQRLSSTEQDISNSDLLFSNEWELFKRSQATLSCDYVTDAQSREVELNFQPFFTTARQRLATFTPENLLVKGGQTLFSLEAFPNHLLNLKVLRGFVSKFGSVLNSPSATAGYYQLTEDPVAEAFLDKVVLANEDGGILPLYPFHFQEISWVLHYISQSPVSLDEHFKEEITWLHSHLTEDGIGASPNLTKDADDSSMALNVLGKTKNGSAPHTAQLLQRWWNEDYGAFETFGKAFRAKPDISTNIHVLRAIMSDPTVDTSIKRNTWNKEITFFENQIVHDALRKKCGYWKDKWHLSTLYPSFDIIDTFSEFNGSLSGLRPTDLHHRAIEMVLTFQHSDGGFGTQNSYGSTVEETSYAVLSLKRYLWHVAGKTPINHIGQLLNALQKGEAYLSRSSGTNFPPLWIAKGLYSPKNVILAAKFSALHSPNGVKEAQKNCLDQLKALPATTARPSDFKETDALAYSTEVYGRWGYPNISKSIQTFAFAVSEHFSVRTTTLKQVKPYLDMHAFLSNLDDISPKERQAKPFRYLMTTLIAVFQNTPTAPLAGDKKMSQMHKNFVAHATDIVEGLHSFRESDAQAISRAVSDTLDAFLWEASLLSKLPDSEHYLDKIVALKTGSVFFALARAISHITFSDMDIEENVLALESCASRLSALDNDIAGHYKDSLQDEINIVRIFHEKEGFPLETSFKKVLEQRQSLLNTIKERIEKLRVQAASSKDSEMVDDSIRWMSQSINVNLTMLRTKERYRS